MLNIVALMEMGTQTPLISDG